MIHWVSVRLRRKVHIVASERTAGRLGVGRLVATELVQPPIRLSDHPPHTKSGASTSVTVLSSLINTWIDGPAVSSNGSPTVAPTTAATWGPFPFPPYPPISMNFVALSEEPPPLFTSV